MKSQRGTKTDRERDEERERARESTQRVNVHVHVLALLLRPSLAHHVTSLPAATDLQVNTPTDTPSRAHTERGREPVWEGGEGERRECVCVCLGEKENSYLHPLCTALTFPPVVVARGVEWGEKRTRVTPPDGGGAPFSLATARVAQRGRRASFEKAPSGAESARRLPVLAAGRSARRTSDGPSPPSNRPSHPSPFAPLLDEETEARGSELPSSSPLAWRPARSFRQPRSKKGGGRGTLSLRTRAARRPGSSRNALPPRRIRI